MRKLPVFQQVSPFVQLESVASFFCLQVFAVSSPQLWHQLPAATLATCANTLNCFKLWRRPCFLEWVSCWRSQLHSSTASYQTLIGQIESPTCPHCGNGDETAEHLLLLCQKWAAERQRYFSHSIDITDVFQDYENLVEFLISSGHLSPHIGSAWRATTLNNNKDDKLGSISDKQIYL